MWQYYKQIDNKESTDASEKCKERKSLSHYTNFESFKLIIKNQNFKLNRIDLVNDLTEKEYIKDKKIISTVFVGCFSYKKQESIPHWYMYTCKKEGIRISYKLKNPLKKNCTGLLDCSRPVLAIKEDETEVAYHDYYGNENGTCLNGCLVIESTDIIYSDNFMKENPLNMEIPGISDGKFITGMAKTKYPAWNFEEESRIIGYFNPYDKAPEGLNHLLIPLDFRNLFISITLNPWSTDDFRKKVEEVCEKYLSEGSYEINNSVHYKLLSTRKE